MRHRLVAAFLLSGILTAPALAQGKPDHRLDAALPFIRIAAPIAERVREHPLTGYLAVYVDATNWAKGLKDDAIGPFLKATQPLPARSTVIFFSPPADLGVAVYFEDAVPVGVATAKLVPGGGRRGHFDAADVTASWQPVDKDAVKTVADAALFSPSMTTTDDGDEIPGFAVGGTKK